jgi:hypothetical protein
MTTPSGPTMSLVRWAVNLSPVALVFVQTRLSDANESSHPAGTVALDRIVVPPEPEPLVRDALAILPEDNTADPPEAVRAFRLVDER